MRASADPSSRIALPCVPRDRRRDGVGGPPAVVWHLHREAVAGVVRFWQSPHVPISAGSITVSETLSLLDEQHAGFAAGVGDGRYMFWLGSGISRGIVPMLD